MQMTANTKVRHHLLELILWPKEDGSFMEIKNSAKRLKELGIYDDFKLTIQMTAKEHNRLHRKGQEPWNKGIAATEESKVKNRLAHIGKQPWNKGAKGMLHHDEDTRRRISEALKGKCKHNTGRHWKLVNGVRTWY